MSLAFVLAAAKKDLARRLRDPWAFLVWLAIPGVLATLIGLVNQGGARPRGRLLVADHDSSFLSKGLASAFSGGPLGEMFDVEAVDEAEGRARMDRGDASALLVLPAGFGKAVLEDEPARIELVRNPSQRILPAIAEEALGLLSEAVFYLQRVAGDRLREQMRRISEAGSGGASPWTESFAGEFGVEIRRTVERLSEYLSPPVIEVDVAKPPPEKAGSKPSFGSLFFPSMVFMALFFLAQGISDDVWHEKQEGTLRRAIFSPQSAGALLAGKLAAAGILFLGVGAVALAIGSAAFGFAWSVLPLAAVWIAVSGVVLCAVLTLVQLLAGNQRSGHLLTNTVVFPLTMIGGAFFPFEAMPAWMATIGKRTPNGWALEEFKAILFHRAASGEILLGFLGLAAMLAVLGWVCTARLRGVFARA